MPEDAVWGGVGLSVIVRLLPQILRPLCKVLNTPPIFFYEYMCECVSKESI